GRSTHRRSYRSPYQLLSRLQATLQQFSRAPSGSTWHLWKILPETQVLKQRPASSYCTRPRSAVAGRPTTHSLRGNALAPMLPMLSRSIPTLSRLRILDIAFSYSGEPPSCPPRQPQVACPQRKDVQGKRRRRRCPDRLINVNAQRGFRA